ncbi:helix-hairpin-helix domain-containing protein [Neobacillus sp. CF12]|uniref:ComEA family DNA-binding protein n=1 Tax=Neobacillus sp. CF12 TaxID=3055864 RepID=UPI0025A1070F|nr:helix-hairpin-helix domain-containing protein [Neobacillus sp. CF12]MDM5329952.1 helix-hairpin-helix domain-containing protein [Neobacillus sp. CF12]
MSSTSKGSFWKIRKSWWILFTFTIIFNWVAFFIIGSKVKHKKWKMYGALYSIPFILLMVIEGRYESNDWQYDIVGFSMLGGWIASMIHAFRIRKEYLFRLEAIELRQPYEDYKLRGQIQSEYGVKFNQAPIEQPLQQPIPQSSYGEQPKPVLQQVPTQPLHSVPPAQIREFAPAKTEQLTSDPIDLNKASDLELAGLPGVGPILAKKAIMERDRIGGFRSLEDFSQLLGLKPHIVEKIRPLVAVGPAEAPPQKWSGRMVDF